MNVPVVITTELPSKNIPRLVSTPVAVPSFMLQIIGTHDMRQYLGRPGVLGQVTRSAPMGNNDRFHQLDHWNISKLLKAI